MNDKLHTTPRIKWHRVGEPGEGFYASDCGRFEINAVYLGRVRPQGYVVVDLQTGARRTTYFGLADAKAKALSLLTPTP